MPINLKLTKLPQNVTDWDVTTPSETVVAMREDWNLAAALLGGTRAMREEGEDLLPRWPAEKTEAYGARLRSTVLFPAYKRTVGTLAAKPFSKPVTIGEDVPPRIKEWTADIDLEGRNLDAFAGDVMYWGLGFGLGGILVEFPVTSSLPGKADGTRSQADETAAGLRPYWVHISARQILGWSAKRVLGKWVFMQLRFVEYIEEPIPPWGTRRVAQIRVLTPGAWETWRESTEVVPNAAAKWFLHDRGVTTIKSIPFAPFYGGLRRDFMYTEPALIEVANLNVTHWQSYSDQRNLLHVARVPILAAFNIRDQQTPSGDPIPWELQLGGSHAVRINGEHADLKYVEHTGAAIDAGEKDLDKLEERMRQAGAELLVLAPGQITATQVSTENAVGMCVLQDITLSLQDSLNLALQYTADWVGEATGGKVTLFNDYGVATLQEASAQMLFGATIAGKLSDATWFAEMQRRGIISADVDFDEEQARLDAQGPPPGALGPAPGGGGGPPTPPSRKPAKGGPGAAA